MVAAKPTGKAFYGQLVRAVRKLQATSLAEDLPKSQGRKLCN